MNPEKFVYITSAQNPRVRYWLNLQEKSRIRKNDQLFLVEGLKEVVMAIEAGYNLKQCLLADQTDAQNLPAALNQSLLREVECYRLSENVWSKLSYRESVSQVIGVFKQKSHRLDDLVISSNPILLVVESVEKPGNLGALLRTADAAALDAVIVCDAASDLFNPNVIRSSVGCVFSVPVAFAASVDAKQWLSDKGIRIFSMSLQSAKWYHECDFKGASAIVMGTEAFGLSNVWQDNHCEKIKIPMLGKNDSLNVSVSAGIAVFEAKRQRGFWKP